MLASEKGAAIMENNVKVQRWVPGTTAQVLFGAVHAASPDTKLGTESWGWGWG